MAEGTRTAGPPLGQFSHRTPHITRGSETPWIQGVASCQTKHSPETQGSIANNPRKVKLFTENIKNCLLEGKCSYKATSDFNIPEAESGS